MPGLTFSNELISRDEGLHAEFATVLYSMLDRRLPDDVVNLIVRGAVEVEKTFICEALSCSLIGMNADLMVKYIEFVADRLLTSGQAPTALEGIDSLECLLRASRGRIAIMAGGGVSATSAAGFGRLLPPHGCLELHGTGGRVRDESAMKFRRSGIYMGGEKVNTDDTEYSNYFVSSERVHGIIQAATNPSPDGV